ncbi:MAG: SDR family oxidoreductase [Planctomycetales bacterium]
MTPQLLAGRVTVITGGSNGIGRATAILFAQHGAHVTVGDIDQMPENEEAFQNLGIRSETCDVREPEALRRLMDGAASAFGRLDILVNNAGVGMVKQIDAVSEEDWDKCLDTNLKGPFFACKAAIPWMIKSGGGSIINVASNAGLLPRAHDPVYSISKGAVVALTKSLGLCHAKDKIRVNAICPGPVERTRMLETDLLQHADPAAARRQLLEASPLVRAHGRLITPEEVAQAALYLASDAAIMVSGTSLAIDGGKSLGVPGK